MHCVESTQFFKTNGANSNMLVYSTHKGLLLCKQILYHNSLMTIKMFRLNPPRTKTYKIFENSSLKRTVNTLCLICKRSGVILVTNQLSSQVILFIISLLYATTCFQHCCAHHQEVKLCYTASGIVTLKQVNGPKLLN